MWKKSGNTHSMRKGTYTRPAAPPRLAQTHNGTGGGHSTVPHRTICPNKNRVLCAANTSTHRSLLAAAAATTREGGHMHCQCGMWTTRLQQTWQRPLSLPSFDHIHTTPSVGTPHKHTNTNTNPAVRPTATERKETHTPRHKGATHARLVCTHTQTTATASISHTRVIVPRTSLGHALTHNKPWQRQGAGTHVVAVRFNGVHTHIHTQPSWAHPASPTPRAKTARHRAASPGRRHT